jgi:hypothetical protein
MLKFTYSETHVRLDRLVVSVEELVAQRAIVALRAGESLLVEPSYAAFLLPNDRDRLEALEAAIKSDRADDMELCVADAEFVELSLRGTWIAVNAETAEGIFVATLSPACELLLLKLWQAAYVSVS